MKPIARDVLPWYSRASGIFLRLCVGLVLLASLGGCRATLFAGLNTTDHRHGIESTRGVVFDPSTGLKLDVYRPAATIDAPVVVFFHGGSWTSGKRQWYRFVGTALASRGIVAVIPDYRKYPQVKMDGFMADAASAVAWAHAHAGEFGGDASHLFIMGHSSGGHIAGLLATDGRWLQAQGMTTRELAGFIGMAGVYDFVPIAPNEKDMLGMFGHSPSEQHRAQPIDFVDGDEPPMLLLHGLSDKEVEVHNSTSLADAVKAHAEPVTLKLYPGMGHSGLVFALSTPLQGKKPVLDDVVSFIHQAPPARSAITP
ncbi:alpha/beta hydrolase [Pinirhizobacter soli]|uniref:alpha/beta hydrolase n=1 Tax=Pinirhizobacter soli TaxID=2786953 RepID=UPI00202A8616|nr:alpha/beta hydrolase [Pinirhizobacter soli]